MNEKEIRLSKYKESLKSAWGYNDYNDWPIKVNAITHLFLKEFAAQCMEDIKEIKGNKTLEGKLLRQFGNPARLYRLIDPVIFGMKRLGIRLEDQREMVIYMLDLVKNMKYGSEFNEDGKNIILSPSYVPEFIHRMKLKKAEKKDAIILQKFCGIMWSYTESIFFRAHEVTKEIHGPYELKDGRQLLVREYLNLKPVEIWHGNVPFLDADNIKIYSVYDSRLSIKIDSYNHLFLNSGDYVSNLKEYSILVDSKPADLDCIMHFMMDIPQTINASHSWVEQTDWFDHANKYMDIYWFRKRPFRMVLNKNPAVDSALRKNIEQGDFDPRRIDNLSEKTIGRLIQVVI